MPPASASSAEPCGELEVRSYCIRMLISAVSSRRRRRSRSRLGTSTLQARLTQTDGSSLHVEEAEDKLVQATETAIGLMKAVLENVSQAAGTRRVSCGIHNNVQWGSLGILCKCS
jgi:hypothetical protein